ncbi:hypothetical protein [Stenotrophomonas phage StenR_269]|nr:hypothetical protein [Stenotrophomonas phage StenR_269]
MLDNITPQSPRIILIHPANNWKAVLTFNFNASGGIAASQGVMLGANDTSRPVSTGSRAGSTFTTTVREIRQNVTSGVWELGYLCNEDGSRLEPVTGDAWVALCNTLREKRTAANVADTAVETARQMLRSLETAAQTARQEAINAQRSFDAAL